MLSPDHYFRSVRDIDFDSLMEAGIDTLLFDLDNTLLPRDATGVPDDLRRWGAELIERGFKVCIVSNNWHGHVEQVAREIGFDIVAKALKPFPFAFHTALRKMGSTNRSAAVVGDQIFTDVLGGRIAGLTTVLVTPLSSSDLIHTRLLRRIERRLLAERRPLP